MSEARKRNFNFFTSIVHQESTESSARNHRRQALIPQADKGYTVWFFVTQMTQQQEKIWRPTGDLEDFYGRSVISEQKSNVPCTLVFNKPLVGRFPLFGRFPLIG